MKPAIHHYMDGKKQVMDAEVIISLLETTWWNDSSVKDGRESEAVMICSPSILAILTNGVHLR